MRYQKLDALRGIALILMILYHANYLLVHIFGNVVINISGSLWFIIGKISVILFLFIAGVSFFLSIQGKNHNTILVEVLKRGILLMVVAVGISIVTFYFAREQFIVFGIIHLFALSAFLMIPFMRFQAFNILIGALVIGIGIWFNHIFIANEYLFFLGLKNTNFFSADYYPIFPWFGWILIGYGSASFLSRIGRIRGLLEGSIFYGEKLSFIGRYSLLIYILHVPILYGIFLLWH